MTNLQNDSLQTSRPPPSTFGHLKHDENHIKASNCQTINHKILCSPSSHNEVPGLMFRGWWRGLYSEVQCIMANGHTGAPFPDRMMDRHDRKHYLPATLLVGDNYPITLRYPAVFRVCTISSTLAYLMHGI